MSCSRLGPQCSDAGEAQTRAPRSQVKHYIPLGHCAPVYAKELERDVTTTEMTKAILRLKTLESFLHRT